MNKVILIITGILVGAGSAVGISTMSLIIPGATIIISSSTGLLTNFAILITNEYVSKLKLRYTNLGDWINITTLLYEKTLKESMIDKKIDQKEAEHLKQIYILFVDKREEIKKIHLKSK